MCWSHNGKILMTGDHEGIMHLYTPQLNPIKETQIHGQEINSIHFSPSDRQVGTCSSDGLVKISDVFLSQVIRILEGHGGAVKSMDWHPQLGVIISGGSDSTIRLWDVRDRNPLIETNTVHKEEVKCITFNEMNGWVYLSASADNTIKVWDLRMRGKRVNQNNRGINEGSNYGEIASYETGPNPPTVVCWHPKFEKMFVEGTEDGIIKYWNLEGRWNSNVNGDNVNYGWSSSQIIDSMVAHEDKILGIAWHPLGNMIVTGSADRTTKLWGRNRPGDGLVDRYLPSMLGEEERMMFEKQRGYIQKWESVINGIRDGTPEETIGVAFASVVSGMHSVGWRQEINNEQRERGKGIFNVMQKSEGSLCLMQPNRNGEPSLSLGMLAQVFPGLVVHPHVHQSFIQKEYKSSTERGPRRQDRQRIGGLYEEQIIQRLSEMEIKYKRSKDGIGQTLSQCLLSDIVSQSRIIPRSFSTPLMGFGRFGCNGWSEMFGNVHKLKILGINSTNNIQGENNEMDKWNKRNNKQQSQFKYRYNRIIQNDDYGQNQLNEDDLNSEDGDDYQNENVKAQKLKKNKNLKQSRRKERRRQMDIDDYKDGSEQEYDSQQSEDDKEQIINDDDDDYNLVTDQQQDENVFIDQLDDGYGEQNIVLAGPPSGSGSGYISDVISQMYGVCDGTIEDWWETGIHASDYQVQIIGGWEQDNKEKDNKIINKKQKQKKISRKWTENEDDEQETMSKDNEYQQYLVEIGVNMRWKEFFKDEESRKGIDQHYTDVIYDVDEDKGEKKYGDNLRKKFRINEQNGIINRNVREREKREIINENEGTDINIGLKGSGNRRMEGRKNEDHLDDIFLSLIDMGVSNGQGLVSQKIFGKRVGQGIYIHNEGADEKAQAMRGGLRSIYFTSPLSTILPGLSL